MEVNGKDFMRNVGLEQEKENLIKEQQKLEAMKRDAIQRDQDYMADNSIDKDSSAYIDLSMNNNTPPSSEPTENMIQDIMLEPEDPNKNKKKYIILGIGLVLLFVITILIIRLMSNNETQQKIDTINPDTKELIRDDILDKIDTNEEYQKVIDRKISLEESKNITQKETQLKEIIIPEDISKNTPIIIDTPKPKAIPKRDLFGLDKTAVKAEIVEKKVEASAEVKKSEPKVIKKPKPKVVKKKVAKKAYPKRKISVAPPSETNFTKKASTVSGYYIQLGAFSKKPSDKLLNSISKKGYNYTVHTMTIKGKVYNKVLIGSYSTRAKATKLLNKVKKDFNNKNAYILKFK